MGSAELLLSGKGDWPCYILRDSFVNSNFGCHLNHEITNSFTEFKAQREGFRQAGIDDLAAGSFDVVRNAVEHDQLLL